MNLQTQGFRFVFLGGQDFRWMHPALLPAHAVDCTDMSDDEFAAFVAATA